MIISVLQFERFMLKLSTLAEPLADKSLLNDSLLSAIFLTATIRLTLVVV